MVRLFRNVNLPQRGISAHFQTGYTIKVAPCEEADLGVLIATTFGKLNHHK